MSPEPMVPQHFPVKTNPSATNHPPGRMALVFPIHQGMASFVDWPMKKSCQRDLQSERLAGCKPCRRQPCRRQAFQAESLAGQPASASPKIPTGCHACAASRVPPCCSSCVVPIADPICPVPSCSENAARPADKTESIPPYLHAPDFPETRFGDAQAS